MNIGASRFRQGGALRRHYPLHGINLSLDPRREFEEQRGGRVVAAGDEPVANCGHRIRIAVKHGGHGTDEFGPAELRDSQCPGHVPFGAGKSVAGVREGQHPV